MMYPSPLLQAMAVPPGYAPDVPSPYKDRPLTRELTDDADGTGDAGNLIVPGGMGTSGQQLQANWARARALAAAGASTSPLVAAVAGGG